MIPELLAPAGGTEQLMAAVRSGADAVYMGGYNFNARRSAHNFSPDEMQKMLSYCRLYGVKTHIAVNTLIKERELPELLSYVSELNDMGADALIIQDAGAAKMIKSSFPDLPLHASTQMTVTSLEGVKYLEDMGFDRVVLARELSKNETDAICRGAKAEIEVFVHGAICQCYSGQCLMSSIIGGRSGNRGRCAQPCRLAYTLEGKSIKQKSGFLLSPKDLALINDLKELCDMGVSSLKIEGRLKRPEYVSAVTGIYRKYLDNLSPVSREDFEELENAFSRSGFTDGYFKNRLGGEMMSSKNSSGTEKGFSAAARSRASENGAEKKLPVDIALYITENEPAGVVITDRNGNTSFGSGSVGAERAQKKPLEKSRALEQLTKLGETPFYAENAQAVFSDDNLTVPIREINAARREAAEELIKIRTSVRPRRRYTFKLNEIKNSKTKTPSLSASVLTAGQAIAAAKAGIKTIYAPLIIAEALVSEGLDIIADTGAIFKPVKTECKRVLASSNAAVRFYKNQGKDVYGSERLNVFNSLTADMYSELKAITLSPELTVRELSDITRRTSSVTEVIGYGRLTLMIMKNCPVKAAGCCTGKQRGGVFLKDRKNERFPIVCGEGCICGLLNSKPLFAADRAEELIKTGADIIKLVFTVETPEECTEIINIYRAALGGAAAANPFPENAFTRGHLFKGVE